MIYDINEPQFKLTLEDYIDNPTGTKNNTVMNLSAIRDSLDLKYDKMIASQPQNKIKFKVYSKDQESMYVHMLIPSSKYTMTYDVVIQIDRNKDMGDLLKNHTFKVFSNAPSFVYTYAYVFNIYDLLIEDLANKYQKEVLTREPTQKNYFKIVSYEKTVYFAILYLLSHYNKVSELERKITKVSPAFYQSISTDIEKIDEYNKKRKREQILRKNDVGTALSHKLKLDAEKRQKRREELYGKDIANNMSDRSRPSQKIKAKAKSTGKTKITGKKKVRGKSKIK